MTRVLAVGHAQAGFGFGRVLSSLLTGLTRGFEVHQLELSQDPGPARPWIVHANTVRGDSLALTVLPRVIADVRPDLIFILGEIWNVPHVLRAIARRDVPIVAYCPIDGPLRHIRCVGALSPLASLVLYTNYAREVVVDAHRRLPGTPRPSLPPITVIPHGLDTTTFHPTPRDAARAAVFGARADLARAFIVLNANRNTPRKRLDLTIRAFAAFAAHKPPHVRLCLHTGIIDQGCNILGVARTAGVLDRLLLPTPTPVRDHPQVDDARLNTIYNACDIGLNTSGGEGWGLCTFEHAATAAAQIVPNHTACKELWSTHAELADVEPANHTRDTAGEYAPVHLETVSVTSVAAALQRYYEDPQHRMNMSLAAFQHATGPDRTWSAICGRFAQLFETVRDRAAARQR